MKSLLKPLSILEIVIGVLTFITSALLFLGGGYINSIAKTSAEGSVGTLFTVYAVISLISALFNLACGICGLKGANGNHKKLNTAIKLGWVGLVMAVIAAFMTLFGNINANSIISSIASAVIPVLFLLSAKSTKN